MSKLRDKIAGEAARETMNMIALIPVEETGKRLENAAEIISAALDEYAEGLREMIVSKAVRYTGDMCEIWTESLERATIRNIIAAMQAEDNADRGNEGSG